VGQLFLAASSLIETGHAMPAVATPAHPGYPNPPISTNIPAERAAAPRRLPAVPEGERHGTIRW